MDWKEELQTVIGYEETTSTAVIRHHHNKLDWLPVYLGTDGKPVVKVDGIWLDPETLAGFERFTHTFLDSATLETLELPTLPAKSRWHRA